MRRCFMGYDPEVGHEGERFYVQRMYELTIYGHTVDAATRERFPEDWPLTEDLRRRGREFACWHSVACPDGEVGSADSEPLRSITFEQFREASDAGWPFLADEGVTTEAPVLAIGYVDDQGNAVLTWDSLRGDRIESGREESA